MQLFPEIVEIFRLLLVKIDLCLIHEKKSFAKVFKNLIKYRSENNFVELSKLLCIIGAQT